MSRIITAKYRGIFVGIHSFIFLHCQLIFQFATVADVSPNLLLLVGMGPGLGGTGGAGGGVQGRLPARSSRTYGGTKTVGPRFVSY